MKLKVVKNKVAMTIESSEVKDEILTIELEPPLTVIQTNKTLKTLDELTKVRGRDKEHFYYFFQSALHPGQNHNKGFFIDNEYCRLMLKESAPCDTPKELAAGIPMFPRDILKQKEEDDNETADDLAQEYLKYYTFKRYNNTFYYFNPETQEWRELNIKDYETFNLMISMRTKRYSQKLKRAIMDSLIPYLYDPKHVDEVTSLKTNLLLFKNKRVLDLNTMKSRPFTANDFIFHILDANWYDDDSDEIRNIQPNQYLKALLDGVSGVRKDDETDVWAKQRREDLLSYIGYTLTNERKEASTLIMFGTGRNGKTTLARLIYDIKASSFTMELETFLTDAHYSAGFYNKRMLFFDELQSGAVNDKFIGKFKALTGNDVINIRPMQKEPYDVSTNFVTYITTNALSPEFFTDRALTRRIKVMNAMKPAPDWHDPRDNFTEGVRQQVNKDWLANHCIRKFVKEGFDISPLFTYDMKEWAVQQNAPIRDLLTAWKIANWADYHGNLNIRNDDLIHLLMTSSGGLKQMSSGKNPMMEQATQHFDEQMNLFMINLLNLKGVRCSGGYLRYDGDTSKLKTKAVEGNYLLVDLGLDNKRQEFSLVFKDGDNRLTWRINQRQEINIRYVLTAVFGWDEKRDGSDWTKKLAEHIIRGTKFNLTEVNGSIAISRPLSVEGRVEGADNLDDDDLWFEEIRDRIKEIPASQVSKRRELLNAHRHLIDNKQLMKLLKLINVEYDEYETNADIITTEEE